MKKMASIALATALAFSLVACGGAAQTQAPAEDTADEGETAEVTTLVGGWTNNDEIIGKSITEEQAAVFQQAVGDLVGVNYEPVAVIGEQLVSGRNYAYLCKATVVAPDAQGEWVVAVIYQDLEGNCSLTTVNPIDPVDIHVVEGEKGSVMGGWSIPEAPESLELPGDSQQVFATAMQKLADEGKDYALAPQTLLATQVVSGVNYQVLCIGSVDGGAPQVFDVTLYENASGDVEVTSIDALDLDFYVTPLVDE